MDIAKLEAKVMMMELRKEFMREFLGKRAEVQNGEGQGLGLTGGGEEIAATASQENPITAY